MSALGVYQLRVKKAHVTFATTTILSYDLLCTLDREVKYIWSNPWNMGSLLFIINRYLPFIDTGIELRLTTTPTTPRTCRTLNLIITAILNFGVLFSEIILILRTYAIWNRSRPVLVLLCLLALAISSSFLFVVVYACHVLQYGPMLEAPNDFPFGCNISRGIHSTTSKYYILVLASETIISILTMVRGFQHRNTRSRWLSQLYRDGLFFYFYMLVVTVSNITIMFHSQELDHKDHLANLQRVVHSICCNRVILDIQSSQDSIQATQFAGARDGGRTMTEFFTTVGPELYDSEIDDPVHEMTTLPSEAGATFPSSGVSRLRK
ncbi:hypothetical protein LshimejAT787_1202230 [Lyophyllum shimeji]|uniref:DUF6533 domain-containing protein n=1 Tax=Lyophyllum shimeji TaxID=47721 RepID=A0A9P3UPH5_LYOSH|nr:hypothetical protein LshimejAT787_1202230 [Lyophyllum shimeji]